MNILQTAIPEVTLVQPDPTRDAPFALCWFESSHGRETKRLMGNVEERITTSTLESETAIIQEFLELEAVGKQLTWAIRYKDETIGAVWLELVDTTYLKSPALHIMIGDVAYRGKGVGEAVMQTVIQYVKSGSDADVLYSRHLASNQIVMKLNNSLGFKKDGEPYADSDGLVFQNIKMSLTV